MDTRVARHQDRARRVVDHLGGRGAEQEALQHAAASIADHDQVRAPPLSLVDDGASWMPAQDPRLAAVVRPPQGSRNRCQIMINHLQLTLARS
jgi:hypothetical protein